MKEESLASVTVDHLELQGDAGSRLRQNDKGIMFRISVEVSELSSEQDKQSPSTLAWRNTCSRLWSRNSLVRTLC